MHALVSLQIIVNRESCALLLLPLASIGFRKRRPKKHLRAHSSSILQLLGRRHEACMSTLLLASDLAICVANHAGLVVYYELVDSVKDLSRILQSLPVFRCKRHRHIDLGGPFER